MSSFRWNLGDIDFIVCGYDDLFQASRKPPRPTEVKFFEPRMPQLDEIARAQAADAAAKKMGEKAAQKTSAAVSEEPVKKEIEEAVKPADEEPKKIEQKAPEPLKPDLAKPVPAETLKTVENELTSCPQTSAQKKFDFHASRRALYAASIQLEVQQEVARHWKPPLGVPEGTECRVQFKLSNDGEVDEIEILESSDIPVYDLSIQRVADDMRFDKILWGKNFTVNFRL
ncbi:hypothetical protein HOD08_03550 [bacterium]|nr:hypothetical protein [bacterium]